ncbi:MAG: hypothetical protein ACR2OA_21390 [Rubripirellula sp.]
MNHFKSADVGCRVTKSILDSIHYHLADPDFEQDEGEVQLIDHDEACLYFGLFEADPESGKLSADPSIIWTVEVSADLKGGK